MCTGAGELFGQDGRCLEKRGEQSNRGSRRPLRAGALTPSRRVWPLICGPREAVEGFVSQEGMGAARGELLVRGARVQLLSLETGDPFGSLCSSSGAWQPASVLTWGADQHRHGGAALIDRVGSKVTSPFPILTAQWGISHYL